MGWDQAMAGSSSSEPSGAGCLGAGARGQERQGDQRADHGGRGGEGGGRGHGVDERAVGGVDQLGAGSAAELCADLVGRADAVARRLGRRVGSPAVASSMPEP